jgi:periplasmic protein TonB
MEKRFLSKEEMEKRSSIKSVITTLVFYLILAGAFIFIGMKTPEKPEPEGGLGMDVMLGNQMYGEENDSKDIYGPQGDISPPSIAKQTAVKIAKSAKENQFLAQYHENAPSVETSDKKNTDNKTDSKVDNNNTQNNQNTENQRTSNPNFEYQKKTGNAGNGNDGIPGYKGKPNGDPNSKNMGDGGKGTGGENGKGFSWKLAGRSNLSKENPVDNGNDEAIVVLEIGVNRQGHVVEVNVKTKGSTVLTGSKVDKAKAAAKKWKFTPKEDAPEIQYGTITFRYRLN